MPGRAPERGRDGDAVWGGRESVTSRAPLVSTWLLYRTSVMALSMLPCHTGSNEVD